MELVAAPHHPTVHDPGLDKSPTRMMPSTALRKREEDSSQTVAFCSTPTTLCLGDEREGFSQGCSGRVGEQYQNLHGIWLMLQKIILNIRIIEKKRDTHVIKIHSTKEKCETLMFNKRGHQYKNVE